MVKSTFKERNCVNPGKQKLVTFSFLENIIDKSEIKRSEISVAEKYVWQNIIIILHGSLRTKYLTEYLKGEKRQKKLGSC